jgi:hypothetical protein
MATDGRITGSFSGGSASDKFTYICDWEIQSQDQSARTSYVKFDWAVYKENYAYRTYLNPAPWAANIDGQFQYENLSFDSPASYNNQEKVFKTTYATIPHNDDGTKTAQVASTLDLSGTSAGTGNLLGNIVLNPIAVNPPVVNTLIISDIGTGYSSVGVYVAGFTKLRLTATATQGDGALATYSFYRGTTLLGTVTTSATTATLDMTTFESAGSFVYSVTVTDAYGLSGSKALSATTIAAYTMPTITASTYRSNSSGTADNEGTYGYCNMTYTVASVGSNSAVVHSVTINGNSYTTFPSIVGDLATTASYDAVYLVTDKLGKSATITQSVQVSFINFDMYPSSNGGAAFGEAAQEDKFIVNQSESIFRGNVNVQGSLNLSDFGAFITSGATQYRDQITTSHSAWGYRYGTVSGNGILIISLSAQKTAGTAGAELVVNVCKQNGSSYDEYAIEQISTAGDTNRWTAINVVAVMKVSNGDKIRLGVYRWSALTVVADTNILALGATVTLDSNFTA